MGLFSFLKNAGKKLFKSKEAEAAEKAAEARKKAADDRAWDEQMRKQKETLLRGVLESLNLPNDRLDIYYDDDVVTVSGSVETQADKEKVILALGNVNGVAYVDDRIEVSNPEPESAFYTVKKGDSLSKIAKRFYGDAMKYPQIFEANRPMLSDPDKIYPGQNLRIPKVEGTYSSSLATYEVQPGDTLGKIAKSELGDASKYMAIYEANDDILDDPNSIKVGQRLTIPRNVA